MKPFWQSKRWAGLMICLLALTVLTAMEAPPETLNYLAGGLGVALPVMIGGESMVDKARVERPGWPFQGPGQLLPNLPRFIEPMELMAVIETRNSIITCKNVEALQDLVLRNAQTLRNRPQEGPIAVIDINGSFSCVNEAAILALIKENSELLKIHIAQPVAQLTEEPTLETSPNWVGDLSRPS